MDIGSFPHQVTRLVFDTGQPYEQFRARYEAAVPALDVPRTLPMCWPRASASGPTWGRPRCSVIPRSMR
jgi:hypothetical protein